MLITPANLNFFFTSLETRFWSVYGTAPTWYDKVATTYSVSSEQWVSGWIGFLNKAREWLGPRVVHSPAPQTYTVQIQNFELTESIDQFKLMDDTYGIYFPVVSFMGEQMKKWPDYQLRDLLQNTGSQTGAKQYGLDGLANWSTVHPVNFYDSSLGTYCNDFRSGGVSVNGVTVGGGLTPTGLATLWEEMASRKSESGEALGLMPDMTMVPAQLKQVAMQLLQSAFYANPTIGGMTSQVGAAENVLKGWTDLLVNADLNAQPTIWYMLVCNKPIKPFSWLLNMAPNFVIRNSPQDPSIFDTHTVLYGSAARGAPAWSFAFLSSISGP